MRSILNPAKDLSPFVFSSDAKLDKHPGLATKKVRTFVYCGFKPELVMIKKTENTDMRVFDARRNPINITGGKQSNTFQFASSNPLWRATLETLDFMPLASANYSGGIVITDWYSENNSPNESVKISVRFLTNEIRSDALEIKMFTKSCANQNSCVTSEISGNLVTEIKKEILKRAAQYEKEDPDKKKNPNKSSG